MKVLSVNSGSSSLKFQLFDMPNEQVLLQGVFERIGIENSFYTIKKNGNKLKKEININNHEEAVNIVLKELLENKVINSLDEIKGIGHRVVHGADLYSKSIIVNDEEIKNIEEFNDLAPLHNPSNILGIKAFKKAIPNAVEVAAFDTAFHQTIKEDKFLYSIPYEYYKKYKIRKYGFHGMSVNYITNYMKNKLNKNNVNLIICHLGNGSSITAIKDGKSYDTSMGFTPNAGVVMSSRSGDIDYSIIPYLIKKEKININEIDTILNKKSGLLGISGLSTDCRDIVNSIEEKNERAILSNKIFVDSVIKYIGKYYLELESVDAIVFTAGIGENNTYFRGSVIKKLSALDVYLDESLNEEIAFGKEGIVTTKNSKIPCYVVPTDEEVMIARDTVDLIKE